MIPRFIIRNFLGHLDTPFDTLNRLKKMGYDCREEPVPADVLVIGRSIVKAPPPGKNPLIKVYDLVEDGQLKVLQQAELHYEWQNEIAAGKFKNAGVNFNGATKDIAVTRLGVLIDNFVVPIEKFMYLAEVLNERNAPLKLPIIATHRPVPAKVKGKLTIGCADYSLADFDIIMSAYNSLTKT